MRTTGASAIHRAASSPPPGRTGWPRASGPTGTSASATPGRPRRIWCPEGDRGHRAGPSYREAMAEAPAPCTARAHRPASRPGPSPGPAEGQARGAIPGLTAGVGSAEDRWALLLLAAHVLVEEPEEGLVPDLCVPSAGDPVALVGEVQVAVAGASPRVARSAERRGGGAW